MMHELVPLEGCADLAIEWRGLEVCANGSPFTSWAWVSVWLRHLPAELQPLVFRVRDDSGLVALGVLVVRRTQGLLRLFGAQTLLLQETGNAELDGVTLEFSGLLLRRGEEVRGYAALCECLAAQRRSWRRLRISASTHGPDLVSALPASLLAYSTHSRRSYSVDLAALRASGRDYIPSLGPTTRAKLRRTLRAYGVLGELRVDIANEAGLALDWLAQMRELHTRYWNSRSKPGAFASGFFNAFHQDFVREGAASGLAQLVRISAGPVIVGYLYTIAWRGHVYYYNSGFNYGLLEHSDSPGHLAHLLAAEHYLADGAHTYDFMAGDHDYKARLGTASQTLHFIDVRPHGWRLTAEKAVSKLLHRSMGTPLAMALAERQPD